MPIVRLTAKLIGTATHPGGKSKLVFSTADNPRLVVSLPAGRDASDFLTDVGKTFIVALTSRQYSFMTATGAHREGTTYRLKSMIGA